MNDDLYQDTNLYETEEVPYLTDHPDYEENDDLLLKEAEIISFNHSHVCPACNEWFGCDDPDCFETQIKCPDCLCPEEEE